MTILEYNKLVSLNISRYWKDLMEVVSKSKQTRLQYQADCEVLVHYRTLCWVFEEVGIKSKVCNIIIVISHFIISTDFLNFSKYSKIPNILYFTWKLNISDDSTCEPGWKETYLDRKCKMPLQVSNKSGDMHCQHHWNSKKTISQYV